MIKRISIYVLSFCLILLPCFAFADDPDDDLSTLRDSEVRETVSIESLRISPSNTSGLHAVVLTLIGDYNPIAVTTSYQYPAGSGYQTRQQVDVTPDWSWIMTCSLFIIVVYCTFKFLGGIFSK